MKATDAAEILLVRAVEESLPEAVPPEARVDALVGAGGADDEAAWLVRRAEHLLDGELAAFRPVISMTHSLQPAWGWVIGLPALAGALTNYLGASSSIHALYNPIVALIAWNLGLYAALALWPLLRPPAAGRSRRDTAPADRSARSSSPARRAPRSGPIPAWLLRRAVPALWIRAQRAAGAGRERIAALATVGGAFWRQWSALERPLVATRIRRLLHGAAIGIALGAVAGMFVRGVFLEYDVVWRSTFLRDPESVALVLGILLAPASILLGEPLPDVETARVLLGPAGEPAARWIGLYAVSAALFIALPRLALAAWCTRRLRRLEGAVELDLADPYFRGLLDQARTLHIERIALAIETDVRAECSVFADAVGGFVSERLYDDRLAPRLRSFREHGGRLRELEEALRSDCESFERELEAHLPELQQRFEASLGQRIADTVGAVVGEERLPREDLGTRLGALSRETTLRVGGSLGEGLSKTIGAAVSAAVAVAAGSIAGGFGHHLGTAVIVALLHTTGPVGFLIGAVGGLAVAGAGWWLGRGRLVGSLRDLPIPAPAARTILWRSRLERLIGSGREKTRSSVEDLVHEELEPLIPRIAEQIWRQVKPALGARITADATKGP